MNDESDPPQLNKPRRAQKSKALSPHYRANDEGGYGNPPVKNQFDGKPGPGRPKKAQSLEAAVRAMFKGKIRKKGENGAMLSMPEAIALQIQKIMFSGNRRDFELGLKLYHQYGPKESSHDEQADLSELTTGELELYGSMSLMQHKVPPGPEYNFGRAIGLYRMVVNDDGYLRLQRISDDRPSNDSLPG